MAGGLLAGRLTVDRGLVSWAGSARRGTAAMTAATMLPQHAVELPEQSSIWLLPGFTNATQGYSFTDEVWDRLALALERSSATLGRDSLVDSGRIVGERANWPLMRVADQVLVAVRPNVRSVHAAQDVVQRLRYELGDLAKVAALVIGDGPYLAQEVVRALGLTLAATLPWDRGAAGTLMDGGSGSWKALQRSPLLRAAGGLARRLTATPGRDVVVAATGAIP